MRSRQLEPNILEMSSLGHALLKVNALIRSKVRRVSVPIKKPVFGHQPRRAALLCALCRCKRTHECLWKLGASDDTSSGSMFGSPLTEPMRGVNCKLEIPSCHARVAVGVAFMARAVEEECGRMRGPKASIDTSAHHRLGDRGGGVGGNRRTCCGPAK